MKIRIQYVFFFFVLVLSACDSGTKTDVAKKPPEKQPVITHPKTEGKKLQSVPMKIVKDLWSNCDLVDFIYYDLPVSMSMDNKKGVQYAVRFIAGETPTLNPDCQSIGQISYQAKGEEKLVAEIYFGGGCSYFVFVDTKGKQLYANEMTNDAISFFNQAVNSVKKKKK